MSAVIPFWSVRYAIEGNAKFVDPFFFYANEKCILAAEIFDGSGLCRIESHTFASLNPPWKSHLKSSVSSSVSLSVSSSDDPVQFFSEAAFAV